MLPIMQQNFVAILICITIILSILIGFKIYKFNKLVELDKAFKEYYENGQIKQEVHKRPIWDYHFFPGLSRLWHQSEWQIAVAMIIMIFLLCLYLYTKDNKLFTLLGLNFGVIVGMMIKR